MSRRARVFGAVRWAAAATIIRALLQFAQIVLFARCLEQADLGLVVVTLSFVAFVLVFTDFGLTNIILHRDDLSDDDIDNLNGFALALGGGLFILSCALSPFLANFYGDSRLVFLISGVGSIFFLNSFWMLRKTLAEKKYLFNKVAVAEIFSGLISFGAMGVALFITNSAYCVLVGPVGYSLLMCFASGYFERRRICWRFSLRRMEPHLKYSAFNLGFSITNSLSSQADIFIGARIIGPENMGGYGVSKDLGLKVALVVNNTVARVSSPLIAESRFDKADLRRVYERVLAMTTFVNFPIYMSLGIFSSEAVMLFFGEKWLHASLLFSIMAFWGLFRSIGNPAGSLLFVLGHTKLAFYFSLVSAMAFLPGYYFGLKFGAIGLAVSMLVLMCFQQLYPIWHFIVGPLAGIPYRSYLMVVVRPLLSALFSFGMLWAVFKYEGMSANFILCSVLGGVGYLIVSFFINRSSLLDVLGLFGLDRMLKR